MKNRKDFNSQEEFDSYVDYMRGNPADDWENALIKVYWCGKADGHWDIEGICFSHRTGEFIWWPENDLGSIPEGKEHAMWVAEEYKI